MKIEDHPAYTSKEIIERFILSLSDQQRFILGDIFLIGDFEEKTSNITNRLYEVHQQLIISYLEGEK